LETDMSEYTIPDGIMALTDDDGTVITLLKRDQESGAVFRHGGEWSALVDASTVDGLNFVGVEEDSVDLYDRHEADGNLVPIKNYTPSLDGPFWPEVEVDNEAVLDEETGEYSTPGEPEAEADADDEAIAASVMLAGADDLDEAIAAAVRDPDLRWYVERRVAALGLEADLPWLKD
jgi:hypothetical protein